jgi:hypothetical protein
MNYEVLFETAEKLLDRAMTKARVLGLEPGEDMPLGSHLEVYRYMDGECLSLVEFATGDEIAAILYDDKTNSFMLEILV